MVKITLHSFWNRVRSPVSMWKLPKFLNTLANEYTVKLKFLPIEKMHLDRFYAMNTSFYQNSFKDVFLVVETTSHCLQTDEPGAITNKTRVHNSARKGLEKIALALFVYRVNYFTFCSKILFNRIWCKQQTSYVGKPLAHT